MSSINLLPKNIIIKENSAKRKRNVFLISLFILFTPIAVYAIIYINNANAVKELSYMDSRLEELDKNINKEILKNKSPMEESKIKDALMLLDNHNYYSKALKTIQNVINNGVYLASGNFSADNENLTLSISGRADNYLIAVDQIAVLKNSYWFDDVKFNNIAATGKNEVTFSAEMKLKKDLILYHERYWDFGLALLSSKINRYFKINEYSAVLKETSNQESFIEVKFSGIAYDEEKLALLENSLKEMEIFVKEVSVSYNLDEKTSSRAIEFNGEMKLNF